MKNEDETNNPSIAMGPFLAALTLNCAVFVAVSSWAFWRQSGLLFNGLDGANMLTIVMHQFAWTMPSAGFSSNPLQGLSDMWFNFNVWISPGYVLPYLFLQNMTVADRGFQVGVYSAHALTLFLAILIMAKSFRLGWTTALIAGWATVMLMFPYFGTPLIYPILGLQPNLAITIAGSFLIVACIAVLGRGARPSPAYYLRDAAVVAVLFVLSLHFLLISPTSIALSLPFFFMMTLGLLLGAETRPEIAVKIFGIVLVAVALAACGAAEFLFGIFSYTAAKFWGAGFENSRMTLYFVSILFQKDLHGISGPILLVLGIAGLVHSSIFAHRRILWVARAGLALTALNFLFGTATVFFDFWRGPSPIYMEAMLWPVFAIFAARLGCSIVGMALSRILRPSGAATSPRLLAAFAAAPVVIVILSLSITEQNATRGFTFPPSQPAMVKMLQERAGLSLDGPIKGRVVVFQLGQTSNPVSWAELHTADITRMNQTGNDFHTIGLWYFGIPTLLEYAPTISPALYRAATHLLARPLDRQARSALVLRRVNPRALAALGIRYIITDVPTQLTLIATEKTMTTETLYLYEVSDAIVGAASPTRIVDVQSFDLALDRLTDPQFDPHATAVTMTPDVAGVELVNLVAADSISVRLVRGGYAITATSAKRSLLVVPIEFSNCLTWQSSSPGHRDITLIRINAIETGILFDGRLDGELRYFTGPFRNASCRIRDSRDFNRVLAGATRTANKPSDPAFIAQLPAKSAAAQD